MNCSKLLKLAGRLHRSSICFQHELASSKPSQSLPANLVLFGISKDRVEETESTDFLKQFQPPDESVPLVRKCGDKIPKQKSPLSVWVDSLADAKPKYEAAAQLHPLVFGVHPRMDVLHEVVTWQNTYREVDYAWSRTRADTGRRKKKPWPQKYTGRCRQGSKNAPGWKGGGISHGPRGPTSLYYKPPDIVLVQGLTIALTIKFVQNDLIIVDDHDLPNPDADYFEEFVDNRNLSENTMLFVHREDVRPENLSGVLDASRTMSLMPGYALNVLSILKHDKLILPLSILDDLEGKLVWQFTRYQWLGGPHNFYKDMPGAERLRSGRQQLYYKEEQSIIKE